jgi:glyoxylate reductase
MSSTAPRRRIFLSRKLSAPVEARIFERYEAVRGPGQAVSPAELAQLAVGCDYLLVTATDSISRLVFEALAPTLKAVATLSVGFNHIDLEAAREFGVAVFYSPGVLSDSCAELGLLLLLGAARRAHEGDELIRTGNWGGFAPTQLLGIQLAGRRAGILGMGRIGQAVAQRLRAFEVEIHYHNRSRLPAELELGAICHLSAESLLAVSDFLILAAVSTPELANFLTRERIALLPPRAIVVNISRGELVDDDALIEALASGRIFAAGLDVFRNEPRLDPRYLTLPNVFLTPHLGSATVDARDAMGFILLDGLAAFEAGATAENQLC